jgi:hypothetical protein
MSLCLGEAAPWGRTTSAAWLATLVSQPILTALG